MKSITDLYNFKKFWTVYTRQNRNISAWDDDRTDMDVFIRRTIGKWFSGKFFQVQIERHKKNNGLPFEKQPTEYKIFTKYVFIANIKFSFSSYHYLIVINYIEPHSEKIEEVRFGWNDFMRIELVENEQDFRILKKFYPISIQKYNFPVL